MEKLYKIAKEIEEANNSKTKSGEMFSEYVGILMGLSIIHQTAHWLCKGESYYGKHLLFAKLYENVSTDLDLAAEKLIGVFGDEFLNPKKHMEISKHFVDEYDSTDFTQRSLDAELAFLSFSEELYEEIKENKNMSLGLDDLIAGIASNHEENVYLLKQQSK